MGLQKTCCVKVAMMHIIILRGTTNKCIKWSWHKILILNFEYNMITFIGTSFKNDLWSTYEQQIIHNVRDQIDNRFPYDKNLFINMTWFGPQFDNKEYDRYTELIGQKFDNLFLLATVDPAMINPDQIANMIINLGNPKLFKLGNFDTDYHFNFFAPVLKKHFKLYSDQELKLKQIDWLFINYNRKPREHRVKFVQQLINRDLKKYGLVTLGKPNVVYDKDPANKLFFTVGENIDNYVATGHWYNTKQPDPFGLPHDVLSLHNIHYWQRHFLHVIGATEFNVWDDIFVSETQFKPIIGLRPFLINGNVRTYQWLRDNGFRTFEKYFPGINFEDEHTVHNSICDAIEQLVSMNQHDILNLYQQMMPDLLHNRTRFYTFADEQQHQMQTCLAY